MTQAAYAQIQISKGVDLCTNYSVHLHTCCRREAFQMLVWEAVGFVASSEAARDRVSSSRTDIIT